MTEPVTDADDCEPCACGKPLVCFICESCAEHCLTEGGPDACWDAQESWRLGKGDPTFGEGATVSRPPPGTQPAPKPRWRS
jgi:hypothetical protein